MNLMMPRFQTDSYFCTWVAQSQLTEYYPGAMRDLLTEQTVFGENGLIRLYPEIRQHLYFVFDDGWDVPCGLKNNDKGDFGSLIVNEEKFPSFTGTPRERLKKLSDRVKECGWRGVGIWVCASAAGEYGGHLLSQEEQEAYWRTRLQWSRYAGIRYWKVDWGHHAADTGFRKKLSLWKSEEYPELIMEHAGVCGPLNGIDPLDPSIEQSGRFADWQNHPAAWGKLTAFSDVLRTYDVTGQLSVPTTLDRVGFLLRCGEINGSASRINGEDEPYICAALGLETGIMRNAFPRKDGKAGSGRVREVIRAVRWMTSFAPAMKLNETRSEFGSYVLTDGYNFYGKKTWLGSYGDYVIPQSAPAVIARGCPLPQIGYPNGEKAYVVASANASGASSAAVLPRFSGEKGKYTPKVNLTLRQKMSFPYTGIFGDTGDVTIRYDGAVQGRRVYLQDMASDHAFDVTEKCGIGPDRVTIPGELIARIGTETNGENDLSAPGVVAALI